MMRPSRRCFLGLVGSSMAVGLTRRNLADDLPTVTQPRATDGDDRFEPNWKERLTVTVGRQKADLIGSDDKVLQAAVDYVAGKGGGTVKVLPGEYMLRAAVVLRSGIRLVGSGAESVITRIASEKIPLAADSDWYDQEVTLDNRGSFRVGDSVVFQAKDPNHGGSIVIKRTIVASSDNRLKLDDGLRKNLWLSGKPTCASLFPLLTSEHTADVTIENITLDGNRANTENFNGNYGGCVFLQDCNRFTLRRVEARNYNGDGISFQICHDVKIDDCHSHGNAGLGVHPGSGSQRPLIRNCRLERNRLGLFWCWGVKFGLAEGNRILGNSDYGISIGHNDTDNVMRNNQIIDSGKVGILFRDDARGDDFWPNRNLVENNRIENSGNADGIGIDVRGKTKDVRIANNVIRESRQPMQRVGIRISTEAEQIELKENSFKGLNTDVLDQRA